MAYFAQHGGAVARGDVFLKLVENALTEHEVAVKITATADTSAADKL